MKPTFAEQCYTLIERMENRTGLRLWFEADSVILALIDRLVDLFYVMPGNSVGGSLHIVLDDSNWEDECIQSCLQRAYAVKDADAVALGKLLFALPLKQRLQLKCVCRCGCCDDIKKEVGLL